MWSGIRQLSSSRSIKETLSVDDVDTLCDNEAPPRFDKIINFRSISDKTQNEYAFICENIVSR